MKKKFQLSNLDCANCAAKIETALNKLEDVENATVSFMLQKLTIEAKDEAFDSVMEKAAAIIRKIEPDCEIIK